MKTPCYHNYNARVFRMYFGDERDTRRQKGFSVRYSTVDVCFILSAYSAPLIQQSPPGGSMKILISSMTEQVPTSCSLSGITQAQKSFDKLQRSILEVIPLLYVSTKIIHLK